MRFWDSSALVPLIVNQPATRQARRLLEQDGELGVWWNSPVECCSALARLRREGIIDAAAESTGGALLKQLHESWYEVQPADAVREQAIRLLRLHPLRAADALQLAAGLELSGFPPEIEFITFDDRLREAARLEGFTTP